MVILSGFIASCAVQPKKISSEKPFSLISKVLVRDKQSSKSHNLNIDFRVDPDRALRMDVFTSLNYYLASFVLRDKELEYLLTQRKQYFIGESGPGALAPVLNIPLDPALLNDLVLDRVIQAEGWSCKKNKWKLPEECLNPSQSLKVRWSERNGRLKRIVISHSKAEVEIKITEVKTGLGPKKHPFKLKIPSSFQKINL